MPTILAVCGVTKVNTESLKGAGVSALCGGLVDAGREATLSPFGLRDRRTQLVVVLSAET